MFSQAGVKNSVHGGGGGHVWQGTCMAGGHVWQGRHAWYGGHVWQGGRA